MRQFSRPFRVRPVGERETSSQSDSPNRALWASNERKKAGTGAASRKQNISQPLASERHRDPVQASLLQIDSTIDPGIWIRSGRLRRPLDPSARHSPPNTSPIALLANPPSVGCSDDVRRGPKYDGSATSYDAWTRLVRRRRRLLPTLTRTHLGISSLILVSHALPQPPQAYGLYIVPSPSPSSPSDCNTSRGSIRGHHRSSIHASRAHFNEPGLQWRMNIAFQQSCLRRRRAPV